MGLFKDCGCGCGGKKQEQKLAISLMAALVFFIVANPDTYRLMRAILGKWVSGPNGCPTTNGLILHTIVFMFVTWGMMNIRSEGYVPDITGSETQEKKEEKEEEQEEEEEEDVEDEEVPKAPVRMADAPSPLPGISEEPIGMYDSGTVFSGMDISTEMDIPTPIEIGSQKMSVSCGDGSRPIIA
ncbi:MAG: hypothetical protein CL881_08895 [Dehalococcoidia bacterium]|nr:hypothetical protein [Dehalococcoidia bacterium]|tara:strand:- start:13841 stop:14392 length:552 start_codon:yes stop_codon:yes gene_type:complete